MLKIDSGKKTTHYPQAIVRFRDGFRAVLQVTIADKKVIPAAYQVEGMRARDTDLAYLHLA